jgi:sigma-E factor negative regulatory protein RseA
MMNEQISAWVDGETVQDEAAMTLESILRHDGQRETCELYWLIGDALRDQSFGRSRVAERVKSALAAEPTVLAPRARASAPPDGARWMPMAAAVAGVAVAAWMGLSLWSPLQPAIQGLAKSAPAPVLAAAQVSMANDQAYYMAHQGSVVGTPMAGVAQYIRTVSDDQVGRR